MSSKARFRTLQAGEQATITNDTGKPMRVVLQTGAGSSVTTTLPLGASIQFNIGQDSGKLFLFEPEAEPQGLRIVRNE